MQASAQLQLYQYSSTPLNLVDPVDGLSDYYTLVHKTSLLSEQLRTIFVPCEREDWLRKVYETKLLTRS